MPASTFEPIATNTVSGSLTTSVTFSNIPSYFSSLVVHCYVGATTSSSFTCRFNNDSGSNYGSTILYGANASPTSTRYTSQTVGYLSYVGLPYATSSYGFVRLEIGGYKDTNMRTMGTFHGSHLHSSTTLGTELGVISWNDSSAVTSITFFAGAYFKDGSVFSLYGVH